MNEEQTFDQRAHLVRGVVLAVDDGAPLQTVDVQTHDGVTRTTIEVVLPWGLVSHAPAGAIAVLGAIGADPADMMALGVVHPGARAGGAAAGTVGLGDGGANRVLIRPGGIVEIAAATSATFTVGNSVLTLNAAGASIVTTAPVSITVGATVFTVGSGGVAITGNLAVDGNITATGTISP